MIETIAAIAGVILPLGGWVLAIQSKVSAQEVQLDAQKELIESKLEDIAQRTKRIEAFLNGHYATFIEKHDIH